MRTLPEGISLKEVEKILKGNQTAEDVKTEMCCVVYQFKQRVMSLASRGLLDRQVVLLFCVFVGKLRDFACVNATAALNNTRKGYREIGYN